MSETGTETDGPRRIVRFSQVMDVPETWALSGTFGNRRVTGMTQDPNHVTAEVHDHSHSPPQLLGSVALTISTEHGHRGLNELAQLVDTPPTATD